MWDSVDAALAATRIRVVTAVMTDDNVTRSVAKKEFDSDSFDDRDLEQRIIWWLEGMALVAGTTRVTASLIYNAHQPTLYAARQLSELMYKGALPRPPVDDGRSKSQVDNGTSARWPAAPPHDGNYKFQHNLSSTPTGRAGGINDPPPRRHQEREAHLRLAPPREESAAGRQRRFCYRLMSGEFFSGVGQYAASTPSHSRERGGKGSLASGRTDLCNHHLTRHK